MIETPPTATRGRRKVREGIVTSDKMQKTIVVRVSNLVQPPRYSRVIHQTSSFKAHDEENRAAVGDRVRIMETRPLSKNKRWRLIEILKQASTAPPVPEDNPVEMTRKRIPAVAPVSPDSGPGAQRGRHSAAAPTAAAPQEQPEIREPESP